MTATSGAGEQVLELVYYHFHQLVMRVAHPAAPRHPRGVLQCVADCCEVCCSVLQCVAMCGGVLRCAVLQCVAVCCSVLQCVAVCCSVLQCFAVCCVWPNSWAEVAQLWQLNLVTLYMAAIHFICGCNWLYVSLQHSYVDSSTSHCKHTLQHTLQHTLKHTLQHALQRALQHTHTFIGGNGVVAGAGLTVQLCLHR